MTAHIMPDANIAGLRRDSATRQNNTYSSVGIDIAGIVSTSKMG
jgi:hypothetical protein